MKGEGEGECPTPLCSTAYVTCSCCMSFNNFYYNVCEMVVTGGKVKIMNLYTAAITLLSLSVLPIYYILAIRWYR